MAVSKILLNPRTISKIDPINAVALTPPTGLVAGKRVLVADPTTGDHATATGTGAFAGKVGKIAIADGSNGWAYENTSLYLDDQIIQVEGTKELWFYWKASNKFERSATGSITTVRQEYNGFIGYAQNQNGNGGYTWTTESLTGSAISLQSINQQFRLKGGYTYNIRYRITATRTTEFTLSPQIVIGPDIVADTYFSNDVNSYTGSGTLEYRVTVPPGTPYVTMLPRTTSAPGMPTAHDVVLSIETVAVDVSTTLPTTPTTTPVRALSASFFIPSPDADPRFIFANSVVSLLGTTIGVNVNNPGMPGWLTSDSLSNSIVKLPYTGTIIITATIWDNQPPQAQRVNLIHERGGSVLKTRAPFCSTGGIVCTNTTAAVDVLANDIFYLKADSNDLNILGGPNFTSLKFTYLTLS